MPGEEGTQKEKEKLAAWKAELAAKKADLQQMEEGVAELKAAGNVGDVAALTTTTEDLKAMLGEVEEALKEREEEVEARREKNDEYDKLKKDVDEQLTKMETGMYRGGRVGTRP